MAKTEANSEEVSSVVSDFLQFLNASPTAFHAVGNYCSSFFFRFVPDRQTDIRFYLMYLYFR